MPLSHIATIAAVSFCLVGILGRCAFDCWRIGCCGCQDKLDNPDQSDSIETSCSDYNKFQPMVENTEAIYQPMVENAKLTNQSVSYV